MKWWFSIGIVLMAVMVGCTPPGPLSEGERLPRPAATLNPPYPLSKGEGTAHEALEEIDSLMWKQPDSAYARLKVFVVSPEAKNLDEFNGHYCQLLISELLYKNYFGQSNREDLLKAMYYFDSLIVGILGTDTLRVSVRGDEIAVKERNVFLDARVHYINGVGIYEKGDVVQACAEYLKALELMEGCFEEKTLTGKKAQFMANTYNRLGDLFSEQFMMESSISCYEKALIYCRAFLNKTL